MTPATVSHDRYASLRSVWIHAISGGIGANRKLVIAVGAVLALGVGGGVLATLTATHSHSAAPAITTPAPVRTTRCTAHTPTTAKGFTALWATLPTSQWGAADTSISVPLADGRVVWLYSDTFSAGRFVHSTAIVEDRGCLHVSHAGAQLLPDRDAHHIYWVLGARAVSPDRLRISARAITLTGKGAWDFRDGGHTRTADASISPSGDVTFLRWTSDTTSAAPDPGPMYVYGPHHFGYARHAHPEFKLASGRTLITTCQNWDDGVLHPLPDYRPIFTEG